MAGDIILGFVIGIFSFAFLYPWKGAFWIIREQKRQIRFLSGKTENEKEDDKKHFWQK